MSKKHDYKSALQSLEDFGEPTTKEQSETIRHAIRFVEKMMQEPSHGAGRVGIDTYEDMMGGARLPDGECYDHEVVSGIFKAMRDQVLKELGE